MSLTRRLTRRHMCGAMAMLGGGMVWPRLAGAVSSASAAAAPAAHLQWDAASRLTQGGWARGLAPAGWAVQLDGRPVDVDAAGRFFIAFDRNAGPVAVVHSSANGESNSLSLAIAPRRWEIEAVNAPFHPSGIPDEAFQKIRAGELAQILAARAQKTGAQGWRQDFHWPARGRISGLFGAQRIYRGTPGAYHPGIDIALPAGTPYAVPADGVVILATDHPFTLEGRLLLIDHGMGLNSAFLHSQALRVQAGEAVTQGQILGLVGMTGRATGPHLHWGLMWRGARLDPLLFTGPML